MIIFDQLPNDSRGFVHKRIGRAARSFVTSGFNPISAAGAFIAPSPRQTPRRPARRSTVARPSALGDAGKEIGRRVKLGGSRNQDFAGTRASSLGLTGCVWPWQPNPVSGKCELRLGDRPGPDDAPLQLGPGTPVGEAVMGRYGAALEPGSRIIDRAVCLPGMVLGDDDKCYNRSQIKNSERMWPRGRRPLLTGGDMRAISIAHRAAHRLTNTAVRLQDMGLIKKPVAKRPPKKKH